MRDLPSDNDLHRATHGTDVLNLVIRAHGELEAALRVVIAEALVEPHELELERLSFPFELDLAIALGAIRNSVRPLFLKLNKTRNDYAHNSRAEFTDKDSRDLINLLTEEHRQGVKEHLDNAKSVTEILRIGYVIAFFEARGAAERVREQKRHREEWQRKVEDFLYRYDQEQAKELTNQMPSNGGVQPTPESGRS
jgi:hypothetical protein